MLYEKYHLEVFVFKGNLPTRQSDLVPAVRHPLFTQGYLSDWIFLQNIDSTHFSPYVPSVREGASLTIVGKPV